MTIFGVPWNDLQLPILERFLADAEPEPLLWEAKGIEAKAGEVRRQVCGFANSHEGGYLIIGASQAADGSWTLDGVPFRDEPPIWVSNVVGNGGVNPYPDGLDTKSFRISEERYVAVVRVPPIATPPANATGTVYERVSGRTISVREPLRLASLFARGDEARKAAETKAHVAADTILTAGIDLRRFTQTRAQFGVGLAAAGYEPDLTLRLFSPAFEERVISTIGELDHGPSIAGRPRVSPSVTQSTRQFVSEGTDNLLGRSWLVRATWQGDVAIYWVLGVDAAMIDSLVAGPIAQAWTAAEKILTALAPLGPRYLQVAVAGGSFAPNAGVVRSVVRRGPLAGGVDRTLLDSIERELRRSIGEMAYESLDSSPR